MDKKLSQEEQNIEQSNQDTSTPNDEPLYFKTLKLKWVDDKVGQCFVILTNMPKKEIKNS